MSETWCLGIIWECAGTYRQSSSRGRKRLRNCSGTIKNKIIPFFKTTSHLRYVEKIDSVIHHNKSI